MLEPLTTSFNIVGSGLSALKQIQKNYEDLRNSFKKNETTITKPFEKMKNIANNSFSFVRNGTVKVGNAFKTMAARSEIAIGSIEKKSSSLKNTLMKLVGLISGGLLIKTAFDTSSTLEMQRTAITNLKGEKRAGELMNFGVDFANKTPFETLEVMDAVKKLEIRGLNPETYLPMIGDMSAALGKGLDQGIEAILDMKVGEFERMKEFGLSKRDIEKLAPSAFDKKGSVINSELMFEKTMKKIKESYEGAMITASKTTNGLISTVKGNFQTLLAELFSGSKSGIVMKDSPLFVFKTKILEPLVVYLDKASKDGTIKRWSQNIIQWTGEAVKFIKKAFGYLKNIFEFAKRNKESLLALASGFLAIKLSLGALNGILGIVNTLTLSAQGFQAMAGFVGLTASKLGLVVFGIGALVAGLIYAYRNFETFRNIVDISFMALKIGVQWSISFLVELFKIVKEIGIGFYDYIIDPFIIGASFIIESIGNIIESVIDFKNSFDNTFQFIATMFLFLTNPIAWFITGLNFITGGCTDLKGAFEDTFNFIYSAIDYAVTKVSELFGWFGKLGEGISNSFEKLKNSKLFKAIFEVDVKAKEHGDNLIRKPEKLGPSIENNFREEKVIEKNSKEYFVNNMEKFKTEKVIEKNNESEKLKEVFNNNLTLEKLTKEKVIEKNNEVMKENIKGSNVTNTSNSSNKTVHNTNTFIIQTNDDEKTKKTIREVLYEEKIKDGEV